MEFNRLQRWFLSISSGLLLFGGWAGGIWQWLTLVGFVPLLLNEHYFYVHKEKFKSHHFFFHAFIAFFVWNAFSTWWILNATWVGAFLAVFFNTLFMSIVTWTFHVVKRKTSFRMGYIFLIFSWIAFEYLHYNWELSWTWMTLGNAYSEQVPFIQWYEYTGVLGGSLWTLLISVVITVINIEWIIDAYVKRRLIVFIILLLVVPIVFSLIRYYTYQEEGQAINVTVVQPNIDPYNDKFSGMSVDEQLNRILTLAENEVKANTDYVVGPETALPQGIWEEDFDVHPHITRIKDFCKRHHVSFILGASTYKMFQNKISPIARPYNNGESFYETYNTALQIDSQQVQSYHKSQLVLGVERMPFPKLLGFLEDLALELGGTSGSLGVQASPSVFNGKSSVAPAVCYESIYGEYLSEFINKGAQWIAVITNDGWWKDTPGYRQHLSFSRLRAIELRKDIARSANTGISAFINQRGDILEQTSWWVPAAISLTVKANSKITFYAVWGDYIGRIASFISLLLLLWTISKSTYQRLNPNR
ncbi:MAG: apolipoprotein N-acyltransferase [Bacteroidales bacterium]|nr:apolipoprotein N-acyltransferase [Bacteroidales bacterium]